MKSIEQEITKLFKLLETHLATELPKVDFDKLLTFEETFAMQTGNILVAQSRTLIDNITKSF